jgi:hypothetical protein
MVHSGFWGAPWGVGDLRKRMDALEVASPFPLDVAAEMNEIPKIYKLWIFPFLLIFRTIGGAQSISVGLSSQSIGTSTKPQEQMQRCLFLDIVVRKSMTVLKLLT